MVVHLSAVFGLPQIWEAQPGQALTALQYKITLGLKSACTCKQRFSPAVVYSNQLCSFPFHRHNQCEYFSIFFFEQKNTLVAHQIQHPPQLAPVVNKKVLKKGGKQIYSEKEQ